MDNIINLIVMLETLNITDVNTYIIMLSHYINK